VLPLSTNFHPHFHITNHRPGTENTSSSQFLCLFSFILPYHVPYPTNTKKKNNNVELPPQYPPLENLADKQEPLVMVAGPGIVQVLTLSNKSPTSDKVPAAPVPAGASAAPIVPNFPVLAADEVSADPVQAGAGTKLPVLAADE
jgi:hypothetical protein